MEPISIYTVERAELVSNQLRKFTSGLAHHVAGHFANLNYWLDEADHAISSIDRHNERFHALKAAQMDWVEQHQTRIPVSEFCGFCGGRCELKDDGDSAVTPTAPRNKATNAKSEARRELVDAVYYFLARCCRMQLLTEQEMAEHCHRFGTSIDPADIRTS